MSHMTQTTNPVTLLASPLGEEGHKVAKGWTVLILIMILYADVTAAGGIIKLIALQAIPQPSGPKAPSNLRTLRPRGRSILRTFPFTTLLHNPRRQPRPLFIICGVSRHHHPRPERPSNLRTLKTLGTKSRQPSHRRCVHNKKYL